MSRERQPFVLVTGNRGKLLEAGRILGFAPAHAALDLPEIQSLDLLAVARAKAREAWRRLERPLVVDETGLELAALNGFPGPLVRWMLEATGAAGLARVAHALDDPRTRARCVLVYLDGDTEVVAEGCNEGRLAPEPRGDGGFGFDPVFVPKGGEKTFAEMTSEDKDRSGHRGLAWRRLASRLRSAGILERVERGSEEDITSI